MPSELERPSMFAIGHRQSDIGPPDEQPLSQGEASRPNHPVRNPHYERWYREHHRRRAYEALTQNQVRQADLTSSPSTTFRNTQATEQVRRPPAANPHLLQQAQSSSKTRRSSQVINGVLRAGSVASSSAKSPLQNNLTYYDGGTPPGPHVSLIPPTPDEEDIAPTNVPPRQNTNSLTVLPRNLPKPKANTQHSPQHENQRHPPSLTPGVAPSQAKVRNVPVDPRDTGSMQQGQRHDTHRPLPALPVEPAVRNGSVVHQGQHHDTHRPLPAPPVVSVIQHALVDHQDAGPRRQGQRYDTNRPLPALPVEPAVDLPPQMTTELNLGNLSRLSYLIPYGGGQSGGVQPVTHDGSRIGAGLDNQTVGSYVRPPGASISSVAGLSELDAGVDAMAELEAAVAAYVEEERMGNSSARDEGPPVLPQMLVDNGLVGLDLAPPAATELPAGDSDELPAAEIETSVPIYELFTRERDWTFELDVAEEYEKVRGTND